MADDQATFAERFTGEPSATPAQPPLDRSQTFASSQYAARYAKQQWDAGNYARFVLGGLGTFAAGAVEFPGYIYDKVKQAVDKGLSPGEEAELATNIALTQIGGARQFSLPAGAKTAFDNFHKQVIEPAAQQTLSLPTQSTPEPVNNSPIPAVVPRSRLAITGESHVDAILNSPATKDVIDNPIIDRSHDVPYAAGGSVPLQKPVTYIDKDFPRAFSIDGKVFDPAEPFAIHENVEQHTMGILEAGGMDHGTAYKVAHFEFAEKAEGAWYKAHDIDKARAEAAYKPYLDAIQRKTPTDVPPDLYKDPYPHDSPFAAQHEALGEPRPTPEEIDRAKQIIAKWQADGMPSPEPEKPPTVNPLAEAHDLGVIGPPKQPVPTDSPAVAAQRAIPAAAKQGDKITMTPAGEPIDAWETRFNDWVDRLDSPEDVKPFIRDAAAQNNNFADARAGHVSPAHIEVLADSAGIDPAKVDRAWFKELFDNPDKVRMAKEAMDQALNKFKETSAKVENDPSPQNIAAMLEAEIRRDYIIEQALGLRAEWGRTGHALRDLLEAGKGAPSTGLAGEIKEKIRPPKTVIDTIDAAREFTKKAAQAKEGDELGLDKLIKQAQALVDENKPKKPGEKAPQLPPDVKELVKTANAVVNLMKAPKGPERVDTVRPLPELIREGEAAPKNALVGFNALVTEAQRNVTQGLKEGKTVREAMPKELRDMVEAAENVTSHFGGAGIQRAVQDLLARKGRTPEDMQAMARSMRGLSNEQAARILTDMRGKQQPWYYWVWQQGLISGEVTHTKYVTTNYGFATLDRTLAPGVAAIIGKLHGGEKVFFGEPVVGMYHLIHGVPDALRASVAAFKSGLKVPLAEEMQLADRATARGERLPRDLLHTQAVPYGQPGAPDWGIWQRVFNDEQLAKGQAVLGFPGRSAAAIHTFFKNLGVEASKHARAYRAAAEEGLSPLSKEFNDRYAYHLANPTDEALRGAVQDGYSGTFMDRLGPLEQRLASYIKDTPWRWAFPFLHIPINIVRQTVRYSPMAWLNKSMREDLTGHNGQVAQDLAISKMVIGSSIMGYFIKQAMMGNATGDYPTDAKERNEWKLTGKIPNAVQYNGQWYQMQRFGPPGNLAMIGADIGSILRHYNNHDDDTMLNVIGHSILASINLLANETGFLSLQNLFDVFQGKQSVAQYVAYQAGTFVPFSSFLYQTASVLDPDARQARTLLDGLKARIPYLREQILPRRDPLYGEPVHNPGYGSPFRGVPIEQDYVKQELDRIGYYPTAPQKKIGGVTLTPEQYDKYEATAGPLVKAALNGLIRSPGWQAHRGNTEWQTEVVKAIVKTARQKAAGAMQIDDPSIIEAGRQRRLTQINGQQ